MNYISLEAAEKRLNRLERESYHSSVVWPDHVEQCREALREIDPADVVSRDCYDRILAENDTMREMLAQIGKKPGDKMDDVRIVKKGEWIRGRESMTGPGKDSYTCSVCGEKTLSGFCGNPAKTNVCPNCGADMRETGR